MRDHTGPGSRSEPRRAHGRGAVAQRVRTFASGVLTRLGRGRVNVAGLPSVEGFSRKNLYRSATFPVLTHPPTVRARTLQLPSDELILGVERGGEAKMYPTSTLRTHHIVNDRLANEPLVVTFCVKCVSGVGFDPVVEGQVLTFAVFGIYQGTFVMRDVQTGTVWTRLTGEALVGPHAGKRLELEPVQVTTFARWLELHPDSLAPDPAVMVRPRRVRRGEQELGPKFHASVVSWDRRLPDHTPVLGVEVPGGARAWVIDAERPCPRFLQGELAGVPFVLLGEPEVFPLAYDRRVGDDVVDLRLERDQVLDRTRSVWSPGGRAVEGPLAGTALRFLPSYVSDWYAWSAYHPGTEISALPGIEISRMTQRSREVRSRGVDL